MSALSPFNPVGRDFIVLGVKTCAEIPVSTGGTAHDPWQIAGETPTAPDGTNDESGNSEYANAAATEPGHAWPFMSWSATLKAVGGGYYPANRQNEGINHYRRGFRLAPRMLGSDGRILEGSMAGLVTATDAANVLDLVIAFNFTTALPASAFPSGRYVAFRFPLGNIGTDIPALLTIKAQPMGPHMSIWEAQLKVGAPSNPETSAPIVNTIRGPLLLDLTATGPDMDTEGAQVAVLFAARSSGCNVDDIDDAGGAVQDGTEVSFKGGACHFMLLPGN